MPWTQPLWDHQRAAIRQWAETRPKDWLGIITPGGGKTRTSLAINIGALEGGMVQQSLVLVPTRPLKRQWRLDAAEEAGLALDDDFDGRLPRQAHGAVITYAQALEQTREIARFVARRPTIVYNDEVHHTSTTSAWGTAIREIEEAAVHRVHLSGTPFRTKKEQIAYLRYDEYGEAIGNYRFDYREALRAGVVRPVVAHPQGAAVRWLGADGVERSATFEDTDLSPKHESERLRAVLEDVGYISEIMSRANMTLEGIRRRDPNAGALAVCMNVKHARRVADVIYELFGVRAPVIVGEDPDADTQLARFKHSRDPWLVAVRKVSEGVNVPRLRVLSYLTNARAELLWRQIVGRIVRVGPIDGPGYVLFPSDPTLLERAEDLAEDVRAIADPKKVTPKKPMTDEEELDGDESDDDDGVGKVTPLEVTHQSAEAWSIGTSDPYALAISKEAGEEGADTASVAALRKREEMRAVYSQLAKQVAARIHASARDIHAHWYAIYGHGIDVAQDEEVEARVGSMRSWLKNGHVPEIRRKKKQAR